MSRLSAERPIRVLHVDDDPQFGGLVQLCVEKEDDGITVDTTTDPGEGLDRLDSDVVDCLVSDYQMPGMDGLELLEAVREEYPNLPFVLFTGKGSEEIASEAINAGVSSYLQKDGTESYQLLANRIRTLVGGRRSERRAQIARDRLLTLYEGTDGFFALDDEWTITYWNRQMEQRTGMAAEDIVGEQFTDAFPQSVDTDLYANYRKAMETGDSIQFDTYYDPHDYWLEVTVQPVDDGLFVRSRDVTDEREHVRELRYRNGLLESFASTVSHDLRSPLEVAEGKLQLAQETGDLDHLEGVAQAHNRMRTLIDELLQIVRGDEMSLSAEALSEVVRAAWETVATDEADLVVESDTTVTVYEGQVQQLFENLFRNGVEHGDATTIRVGTLDDGFYVEDDGAGIPAEHRERVFESGFSTAEESPGYGLSIVDSVVDVHGWEVSVGESAAGGARFEITRAD